MHFFLWESHSFVLSFERNDVEVSFADCLFFFATVLEDLFFFFQLTGKLCKVPFLGSSRAGVSKL